MNEIKAVASPSVIKNTIYSFILQIASLALSVVTSPYISDVLGTSYLGKINFMSAFASWFSIFSIFGISTYGVRVIAKCRDDKNALSKAFSELIVIRIIFTAVSFVLFAIIIASVARIRGDYQLAVIQLIVLILNIFSIDWFFQGLEDYRYIAIRSLIFKIISVAAVFIFIKTQQDFLIYAVILAASNVLSNILNVFYVRKKVKFSFKDIKIMTHARALIYFFFITLLINIYSMIDQTLLGFIKSDDDVALLARARLFFGIAATFAASINSALSPRLINRFEKDEESYKKVLPFAANTLIFVAVPITVGMVFISEHLLFLLGNKDFVQAKLALQILAMAILTVALGGFNFGTRVIPRKKENVGVWITLTTALINLGLNILLIKNCGIVGCAIAYFASEMIGNAVWFIYMQSVDKFRIFLRKNTVKYYISGLIMGLALFAFQWVVTAVSWWTLIANVAIAAIIYCVTTICLKDEVIWFIMKKTVGFIKRNKKSND